MLSESMIDLKKNGTCTFASCAVSASLHE
jgi:hypothetical protein